MAFRDSGSQIPLSTRPRVNHKPLADKPSDSKQYCTNDQNLRRGHAAQDPLTGTPQYKANHQHARGEVRNDLRQRGMAGICFAFGGLWSMGARDRPSDCESVRMPSDDLRIRKIDFNRIITPPPAGPSGIAVNFTSPGANTITEIATSPRHR